MSEFPAPLVPSHVDLRDFEFMPLDVARLRDSDLAALSSPEECWAAVLLWCASWHQVPCGSLPDNDKVLSNFAGYGRVVREWQKVRAGALRGFIKCADGRLYHPVVAEKAMDGWWSKVVNAWEKECDRLRKENKRRKEVGETELPIPPKPLRNSIGFPPETQKHSSGNPMEKPLKGQGQGEGQEEDKKTPARDLKGDEVKIIRALDDAIEEHYGPERRRPCPHSTDFEFAKQMLETGASLELICQTIEFQVGDWASQGQDPPKRVSTFEKWVAGAYRDLTMPKRGKPTQQPDKPRFDQATEQLIARIAIFRSSGRWDADRDGPAPGEPGCRVPSHLLVEPVSARVA